jgi:hypothetical protein
MTGSSGRSGIPRHFEILIGAGDYWIPAFAGMTTICVPAHHSIFKAAASLPENCAIVVTPPKRGHR